MGPLGCIPVGLMLIAAGLAPYAPEAATAAWWTGVAAWAAALALGLARLAQLGFPLRRITPAWLVLLAGALVAPAAGLSLGHEALTRWAFSIGMAMALALAVPLFLRARLGPPLPEAQRYAWFIPIAPLSLIAVQGYAAFRHPAFAVALYLALVALACVAWYARDILRWPFSETVWSITFPLDALALATARHALLEQSPAWRTVAAAALLLATLAVVFSLYKTVTSLATRRADARVQ
jgi:tellurite resistance protein